MPNKKLVLENTFQARELSQWVSVVATQAGDLEFEAQPPFKKLNVTMCALVTPGSKGREYRRILGFAGHQSGSKFSKKCSLKE